MRLVIDANVLFAAFIRRAVTQELLLDSTLELFAPEFLLDEFKKYWPELIRKSGMSQESAVRTASLLLDRISIVRQENLEPFFPAAKHLTNDPKDEVYAACALAIGADIWSKDKGFIKGRIRRWSTAELAELLLH